ncbi:sigma-70 family RNA polymerase sigma factor [Puniceicoccaceae bacterium K14]|nr:sigma-70 family RNA polymerase sigma factor [Puniceicoccaceae bacterium K14]
MNCNSKTLALYIAHRKALVNYASSIASDSIQAEDIVQEAYIRFDEVMALETPVNPVAYFYRIVRNLALDFKRRSGFESQLFPNDVDNQVNKMAVNFPSPQSSAETNDALQKVLGELPERTRMALEMHRLGGFKLKEIAEHLDISSSMAHLLVKEGIKHCQRSAREAGF